MSDTLRLTIEGDYKAHGATVIAYIRPLRGGEERRIRAKILETTEIDLDAGRYLIDVVLPSGERLQEVAEVKGITNLTLAPVLSTHEWLGLQSLLVPRQRLQRPVGLENVSGSAPAPRVYFFDSWSTLWNSILQAHSDGSAQIEVRAEQRLLPTHHDELIYRFEIEGHESPEHAGGVVVEIQDRVVAAPIALHWYNPEWPPRATELIVNAERRTVSIAIEDPEFAILLGYLASGRSELAAEALGDLPKNLLYEKVRNPLAAAAGAYILVDQLHDANRAPEWRGWITNLSNWFPALPDGAILEGRALLHDGKAREACASFLRAFERGMPFFAAGLRMLLSGLLSFSEDEVPSELHETFEKATADVRRWATWLDPRESIALVTPGVRVEATAAPLVATA